MAGGAGCGSLVGTISGGAAGTGVLEESAVQVNVGAVGRPASLPEGLGRHVISPANHGILVSHALDGREQLVHRGTGLEAVEHLLDHNVRVDGTILEMCGDSASGAFERGGFLRIA